MDIRGLVLIDAFVRVYRDSEGPLRRWVTIVTAAQWQNFPQCRGMFPHADQVAVASGIATVFNIKGNHYRLVAGLDYARGLVAIWRIMTHAEYNKEQWKGVV
jgi:mRNA interferase HigB